MINTVNENSEDQEGNDGGAGVNSGQRVYHDSKYGSASVILGYCEKNFSVSNCSVRDAYVEASYFTSAIIGIANECYPNVKNCLVADVRLIRPAKKRMLAVLKAQY